MPDAIPLYDNGDYLPCKATAAVTGARFVAVSANRDAHGNIQVAQAGAGADVLGVAQQDAAINAYVTVCAGPGIIVPVTAGAALVFGQAVQSDATGQAIPLAAGVRAGKVIAGAAAGAEAFVKLFS